MAVYGTIELLRETVCDMCDISRLCWHITKYISNGNYIERRTCRIYDIKIDDVGGVFFQYVYSHVEVSYNNDHTFTQGGLSCFLVIETPL